MIRARLKLEAWHSEECKRRFKVVRTDSCADVPGTIGTADEETGEAVMMVDGFPQSLSFGQDGIRIIRR